MSASQLQSALAAMNIDGEIESHGTVAVLLTSNPQQLAHARVRAAALDAAMQHGFRTLAVALPGPASISDSRFPMSNVAQLHRS